jgi:ferric-dicitrate binding protein FerR (iron transport regulator)
MDEDHDIARLIQAAGPRPGVDAGLDARVRAAVRGAWRDGIRARRRRRWLSIGGTLGVAAAAAWFSARPDVGPTPAPQIVAGRVAAVWAEDPAAPAARIGQAVMAGERVRTGPASRLTLAIDGGAELRFDVETTVRLESPRRFLLESGAVYLDTGPATRAAPPAFAIATAAGLIHNIGTRFEVRSVGDAVRIRVRDGTIRFERRGIASTADAGVELAAAPDGRLARGSIAPDSPDWSWTHRAAPDFAIEGATLASFLGWASREIGTLLVFDDDALRRSAATTILHGSARNLTPVEALADVLPTCGLTHRIDGGRLVIERLSREIGR